MKTSSNQYSNSTYRKSRLFLVLFIALFSPTWALTPLEKAEGAWHDFRKHFPQPYRAIACQSFDDGSRVFILSEPPDAITVSDIKDCMNGYYYKIWTRKWAFGYDGWVKDVLLYVNGLPDFEYDNIVLELNRLMYGTTHNSSYIKLPIQEERKLFFTNNELNLHINAASIHSWLMEQPVTLTTVPGERGITFLEAMASATAGVYRANGLGLILFCLPVESDITNEHENIRIFATESDLILGAIDSIGGSNKMIAIIGRERQVNIVDLPPLRTDEIQMLASAKGGVSQSLNVSELCHCKLPDGADWCPAWVSKEIEQTEYGHLMTQTDVYLKMWITFPTYKQIGYNQPVPEDRFNSMLLLNRGGLRYNWNTKDYLQQVVYPDCRVYTVQNTSMVNKNLFDLSKGQNNEIEMDEVEQPATDFFLKCGNVDIARVAQYTTLYQLFQAEKIISHRPMPLDSVDKTRLLLPPTQWLLNRIKTISDKEIDSIAHEIYHNGYRWEETPMSADEKRQLLTKYTQWKKKWDKAIKESVSFFAVNLGISEDSFLRTKQFEEARDSVYKRFNKTLDWKLSGLEAYVEEVMVTNTCMSIDASRKLLNLLSYSDYNDLGRYTASPNSYYWNNKKRIRSIIDSISMGNIRFYPHFWGYNVENIIDGYSLSIIDDTIRWYKQPSLVVINNLSTLRGSVTNLTHIDYNYWGGHSIGKEIKSISYSGQPDIAVQPVESIRIAHANISESDEYGELFITQDYSNRAVVEVDKGNLVEAQTNARKAFLESATSSGTSTMTRKESKIYKGVLEAVERQMDNQQREKKNLKNKLELVINTANKDLEQIKSSLPTPSSSTNTNNEQPKETQPTPRTYITNTQPHEAPASVSQPIHIEEQETIDIYEQTIGEMRTIQNTIINSEDISDDEIKRLKEEVRRLTTILINLKKNQNPETGNK